MLRSQKISTKVIIGASLTVLTLIGQSSGPKPTCRRCSATYISVSELDAYTAKAVKYQLIDQQVRSVDIGKIQVGIGMVTRGRLLPDPNRKGAVAEHEQVTQGYHVIDGEATLLPGPDLANPLTKPAD